MMMDGIGNYEEAKGRLVTALKEREILDRRLEDAEVAPAVAMHPGIADAYRRNVEKLADALASPGMEGGEARQALRNLVELITAEPKSDGRGLDLVVHGRLAQILQIANDRSDVGPDGCMFSLVAGTGFEAVTFKL